MDTTPEGVTQSARLACVSRAKIDCPYWWTGARAHGTCMRNVPRRAQREYGLMSSREQNKHTLKYTHTSTTRQSEQNF